MQLNPLLACRIACLVLLPASAWAQLSVPSVSLGQALEAASANLDVTIARSVLAAGQAEILVADRPPVPVVTLKSSQIDLQNGTGAGNLLTRKRIDKSLGVDWTWERGDKRRLRTQAATSFAQAAQADVQEIITQQQIAASNAFWELAAAQERASHVQGLYELATHLEQTTAQRVKAGDLPALEGMRADVEARRAAGELQSVQLEQRRSELALRQILRRNDEQPLVAQPTWPVLASQPPAVLQAQERSDVLAARLRVEAAEAAKSSALALRQSDITLGSSIDHYPSVSTRLVEFRVQIPLQGVLGNHNYEGEAARALAQLNQAQDALEKVTRAADAEARRLAAEISTLAERARQYQTVIVPRARQIAQLGELAYSKGAMSLTELIDTRRTLRSVLLEELAVRADYARAYTVWQIRSRQLTATLNNSARPQ